AGRRDRAAHRGAQGREKPARFRGRRRHPDCPRRAWHPARRQSRRHALETKVKRPDPSERRESRVPDIRTELPGPKARDIIARDRAAVSTSYTRDYPFVIAKGSGAVVEDVDGNVFLDCTAGIAVASTGHSHPDVVKAITEQAQKFLHMSGTDFYYELQARLGEEVAGIMPMSGPHRSFF